MESKDKYNKKLLNNDSTVPKLISGKKININNNNQELYEFRGSYEKKKSNGNELDKKLFNVIKIDDFLKEDSFNKIALIMQIPKKSVIIENFMKKRKKKIYLQMIMKWEKIMVNI